MNEVISGNKIFNQFKDDLAVDDRSHILSKNFDEITICHDNEESIFWFFMDQKNHPTYTYKLGEEVDIVHNWVKKNYANKSIHVESDLKYFVTGSKTPNVFNFGGDLNHFAECVKNQDYVALKHYAETCIRMQYTNYTNFNAPIISIALVQGDALGGGFEHALASDIIVAEKNARLGLPEILFNLFPGMGAYSFLSRRVGCNITEKMILEGKLYSASELYEMGIVDILAEDGDGEDAVIQYVSGHKKRFAVEYAVYQARKYSAPVTLDELMFITDQWVNTAKTLKVEDIKKMQRLARAQLRKIKQIA